MYNYYNLPDDYLMHYGVKGMKWGHRKPQAFSVKATGHRMAAKIYDINAKTYKKSNKTLSSINANARTESLKAAEKAQADANAKREARIAARNTPEAIAARKSRMKKAAIAGATIAGTALAAYGAKKLNDYVKTKNVQIAAKQGKEYAEKSFSSLRDAMLTTQLSPGTTMTFKGSSGGGAAARDAARRASNENFRTAARNVVNYAKSNGRGSLRNLPSANYYINLPDQMSEFTRRG